MPHALYAFGEGEKRVNSATILSMVTALEALSNKEWASMKINERMQMDFLQESLNEISWGTLERYLRFTQPLDSAPPYEEDALLSLQRLEPP